MKHIKDMELFMRMLEKSDDQHLLIVQSAPGWGKSTSVNSSLKELGMDHVFLGSYSTPLFFYNALCEFPDKVIVLDDCAGLFDNLNAMALLKAATTVGQAPRVVTWGTSSDKALAPKVTFRGKLILLTNVIPQGRDTEAFKDRAYMLPLRFSKEDTVRLLTRASKDKKYFPKTAIAQAVVKTLIREMASRDYTMFNLRTLRKGYDMAVLEPKKWREALLQILPTVTPENLVKELAGNGGKVEDQFREFSRTTGMSRQSFNNYRREAGLQDPTRVQGQARRYGTGAHGL